MKATFKGKYEVSEKLSDVTGAVSLTAAAGDLRLKATATEATFSAGPSLNGVSLAVEKPGAFILDLNVPKKDLRFQFMNSARVMDKSVNLTYTHMWRASQTAVDCSVTFDPANKVSVNHTIGSSGCRVKYMYAHGEMRRTIFEPSYDMVKNVWDFAVTRKFEGGDAIKGTYHTSSKLLGLEWIRDSKINGSFKVSASLNLEEENKAPTLMAERTWNYEM